MNESAPIAEIRAWADSELALRERVEATNADEQLRTALAGIVLGLIGVAESARVVHDEWCGNGDFDDLRWERCLARLEQALSKFSFPSSGVFGGKG